MNWRANKNMIDYLSREKLFEPSIYMYIYMYMNK